MLDSKNASGLKLVLVELNLTSMHFKNKKHLLHRYNLN